RGLRVQAPPIHPSAPPFILASFQRREGRREKGLSRGLGTHGSPLAVGRVTGRKQVVFLPAQLQMQPERGASWELEHLQKAWILPSVFLLPCGSQGRASSLPVPELLDGVRGK
ncbi:mCG144705, partial [Mus musculus]